MFINKKTSTARQEEVDKPKVTPPGHQATINLKRAVSSTH